MACFSLRLIRINGKNLGVCWKPPYRVDITDVLVEGINKVEIEVTNTWFNRLTRDAGLPEEERRTWVLAGGFGGRISANAPLVPSGLLGPVSISAQIKLTDS